MLRYLVDPIFQVINTAGKPATGGYVEVYLHGTRDKYYCASDFEGTLHPFKIPLDSLGANIILADDANAYDIYVYNRYGSLLMSRYNVAPVQGGGSEGGDAIGKVHFLKAVYDSLVAERAPYGYWIVDLEKPNPQSPYGYDYAMADEIIAKLSAGEIFVLSTYPTAPSPEEDLYIMCSSALQSSEGHTAVRIWFTQMFSSNRPEYMRFTTIYTPSMYNNNNFNYPEGRMAILNWRGQQDAYSEFRFMEYTKLAEVATSGSYDDLNNKPNLALKEDVANKSQTIDATSTTEYPSSKAAADFVTSSIADIKTTTVRQNGQADNAKCPTEAAVRTAIDSAVSSAYHAAGPKRVSQLTSSLLVAANQGDVYNMIDSGTTTADFVEGPGCPIRAGDNVGICDVGGGVYKFDLLSGFVDLSSYLAANGDGSDVTASFTAASTRTNVTTGEKLSVLFGKIKKWFTDLKALAFKNEADLTQDVSGILPIANGGTNASTASGARTNFDVYSKSEVDNKLYKELHRVPNGGTLLAGAKVGDILWVDPNNGDKYFFDKAVYPVSQAVADGLESVGVVADVNERKLLVLHKDESTDLQFANCWLFKVTDIHLDGTTNTLNMQQHASNDSAVSAGTFTDNTSTTLAEFCTALDTWLREHQTVAGASVTNWHCELMPDADGVDSCYIVVDTNSYQNRLTPIASGSTATAKLYMWQFAGQNTDRTTLLRNNGSSVYYAGWNKERLIEWFSNPANASISPTNNPNGDGLLNLTDFNGTSYPAVKEYYGDYETYMEAMMMKWPSKTGSQVAFAGTGKNIGLVLGTHTHKNLAGESVYTFPANRYSYTRTTEATRKSDGLGDGDWYLPDVVDSFNVFSKMKVDGTDAINDSLSAISSRRALSVYRWCSSRSSHYYNWLMYNRGLFGSADFSYSHRCCSVALLEY